MTATLPVLRSLMSPLKVGDITIRNRLGMSALTRARAPGAVPNDVMTEYYAQRAKGGAGLIISEGTLITRQGTEWKNAPGIWSKDQVVSWKKTTDAVHATGGHMYAQLWHVGRLSHPETYHQKLAGTPVYAPSAIASRGGKFRELPGNPGYVVPIAVPDPKTIIEEFRNAAINAKEAGFDGVELHGANGYLITQFLDSNANHRTDQWGGSVENRARFGLEVLKVMIDIFGRNVSLKISPCGGNNDVGMPLQETLDTFRYFIGEADKLKLAYITLMRYGEMLDVEYDGKKRAMQHDVLESYRPVIQHSKLFLNAGVLPAEGDELIAAGKIDGIFMGFPWATHPDVTKRTVAGKPFDNVPNFPYLMEAKSDDELEIGYTDYPAAAV